MNGKSLFIVAAVLGLALGAAGCNRQESSKQVREDVAEAQQDRNENVAEQQADAVAANDKSPEDRAEADYDVAIAKADGDRKVAEEACEALSGEAQENCKRQAEQQKLEREIQRVQPRTRANSAAEDTFHPRQ